MAELNAAVRVVQVGDAVAVRHVDGRIQKLGNAVQRCLAAGGLFDQHRDGHDGPDDGLKVADVLHKLTCVELPAPDEPAAVAQNHADDRLDEQRDQHLEQCCNLGIGDVDLLVLLVEAAEGNQLLELLHKRLDDRNAGKVLLRKVGQVGERLLALLPPSGHDLAHDGAEYEHDRRRDQRQKC